MGRLTGSCLRSSDSVIVELLREFNRFKALGKRTVTQSRSTGSKVNPCRYWILARSQSDFSPQHCGGSADCANAAWIGVCLPVFAQSQTGGSRPEWAWMGGNKTVPSGKGQPGVYGTQYRFAPSNTPGCRNWGALSWTDRSGRLWLFGGFGYDASGTAGYLGDMWIFDPSHGTSEKTAGACRSERGHCVRLG